MGSDEPIATVGDVFDLVNGFAFKSADFVESGIPVIKIKNVKAGEFSEQGFSYVGEQFLDKRRDKLARIGDLLISMSGNRHDGSPHTWVGKVAYFNKPGRYFINQRVGVLRPKQGVEVDLKFAAYVLASMSYQEHFIAVATSSGGQANLSPTQILGAPLNLPCYEEQHEIGRLISALDDRIDLLHQTNTTLEAITQALFKSWFVDFDPVHAKAEGREPEAMDAATATLYPSEFEESELGLIPKGWHTAKVDDVVTLLKGRSYKSSELDDSDTALVTLKSFNRGGGFRRDGFKPYTGAYKDEQIVHEGDCIVAFTDVTQQAELIGRTAIVTGTEEYRQLVASLDVGILRSKIASLSPAFLRALLSGDRYVGHIKGYTTGTTVLHLAKDGLSSYPFVMPPDDLISRWSEIGDACIEQQALNVRKMDALAELRDTLLPRLISGKLRLPEATEATEADLA